MSNDILKKAKKIKLLISDVDGVLTNGQLIFDSQGKELKAFHARDGLGINMLKRAGIEFAIITKRISEAVTYRAKNLKLTHVYQGQENKTVAYNELLGLLNVTDDEVAYIGDDLTDLVLVKRAGLGATVADAPPIMHKHADWISSLPGGHGAVRELCDLILLAQDKLDSVQQSYLESDQ
ncbi:MAG: 3-deoxy-manno-octulosonate-8-phosphatase KdsC [Gammaproteobacteria bacterium]|nr:3-deoxy-manno-octulosonate-8-phosphatase KdsC [Gammaproteobacteria bacterium]